MIGQIKQAYVVICDVDASEDEVSQVIDLIETTLDQEAFLKSQGIDLENLTDSEF